MFVVNLKDPNWEKMYQYYKAPIPKVVQDISLFLSREIILVM